MKNGEIDLQDGLCNGDVEIQTPDELFNAFRLSSDFLGTVSVFKKLCHSVDVNPSNYKTLYSSLRTKLTSWKCKKSLGQTGQENGEQGIQWQALCEEQSTCHRMWALWTENSNRGSDAWSAGPSA